MPTTPQRGHLGHSLELLEQETQNHSLYLGQASCGWSYLECQEKGTNSLLRIPQKPWAAPWPLGSRLATSTHLDSSFSPGTECSGKLTLHHKRTIPHFLSKCSGHTSRPILHLPISSSAKKAPPPPLSRLLTSIYSYSNRFKSVLPSRAFSISLPWTVPGISHQGPLNNHFFWPNHLCVADSKVPQHLERIPFLLSLSQ